MNVCILSGRTTADVELRYTANGKAVGGFTLAVDDGFGEQRHTSFFNVTAWGTTAESLQKYVPKGTKISIMGRAVQEEWQDKNGVKRHTVKFIVSTWEFAQSKVNSVTEVNIASQVAPEPANDFTDAELDDLPFN